MLTTVLRACFAAANSHPPTDIYSALSEALGLPHVQIFAALVPPCTEAALRRAPAEKRLECNLSVPLPTLRRKVYRYCQKGTMGKGR